MDKTIIDTLYDGDFSIAELIPTSSVEYATSSKELSTLSAMLHDCLESSSSKVLEDYIMHSQIVSSELCKFAFKEGVSLMLKLFIETEVKK